MAKYFSYLFHPVFMPFLGILIIIYSGIYNFYANKEVLRVLYLITGTFTILLPLGFLPIYLFTRMVKDIRMNEHRQRIIPYFITFIFFYTGHLLIKKLPLSSVISSFTFASAMTVLLLLLISYFWKISSHMAGIGGLTGLIICLSFVYRADLMIYLIVAFLLSGFLASARLKLEAHNGAQVLSGFFLGLVTVYIICLVYSS